MTPIAVPWGSTEWILNRSGLDSIHFFGAISSEERSLAAFRDLAGCTKKFDNSFVVVRNSRFTKQDPNANDRLSNLVQEVVRRSPKAPIDDFELFAPEETIFELAKTVAARAGKQDGNVLMDISSLPRRFFFPIIRELLGCAEVRSLIIAYSKPVEYAQTDLGVDPTPGSALPGFGEPFPEPRLDRIIIGGGFTAPGFLDLLDQYHDRSVRTVLLMPFPSDAPRSNRIWQFAREIDSSVASGSVEIVSIPFLDVGLTFDHLRNLTDDGESYAVMFPYGPKTVSLAMCMASIAASKASCPPAVIYAQPNEYVATYSSGVAMTRGTPVVNCYPIKLDFARRF